MTATSTDAGAAPESQDPAEGVPSNEEANACIEIILDGQGLNKTSLKKLRRSVAEHLQLGKAIPADVDWDGFESGNEWVGPKIRKKTEPKRFYGQRLREIR